MNDDVSVEVVLGLDCIVYNYFFSNLLEHKEERKKRHDLAMKDFQKARNKLDKERVKRLDLINKRLRDKQHAKRVDFINNKRRRDKQHTKSGYTSITKLRKLRSKKSFYLSHGTLHA